MKVKTRTGFAVGAFILLWCNLALSWLGLRYLEDRRSEFRYAFSQISKGMSRESVHELLAAFGPPKRISEWWSQTGDFDLYSAILTHRPPDFVTIKYVDGMVVSASIENGDRVIDHRFDPSSYSQLEYWSGSATLVLMIFDMVFLFCLEAIVICIGLALSREFHTRTRRIVLATAFAALIYVGFLSSLYSMVFYVFVSWV